MGYYPPKPRPVATLEVTVVYSELPDRHVRESIVEHLRGLNTDGAVIQANLDIATPIILDLIRDL